MFCVGKKIEGVEFDEAQPTFAFESLGVVEQGAGIAAYI
jgi:hypothetical protein